MKRVQYHRYGGSAELRLEEVERPPPGPGQVRVQIRAAAANPMDWKIPRGELKMMTGRRFPRGLGHDFSGVIEALGKNVTRFKVGDEVFGAMGLKEAGTFAEALVTQERLVFPKSPSISFEAAAALPVVSATAWFALIQQAKLQAGHRVFINGCLGGVGRLAVQIARMRGAEVTGSCSAARRDEALALGVQEVMDYRAFDASTYRNCFDVVFDTQGSLSPREGATMLKPGGLVLDIVPTPLKMIQSRFSSRFQTVISQVTPQIMAGITAGVEQGQITPAIGRTVPLSEVIPALIELEHTRSPLGKLVVAPMGS